MRMTNGLIILDLCGGTGSWSKPYAEAGYDVRIIDPKFGGGVMLGYSLNRKKKYTVSWPHPSVPTFLEAGRNTGRKKTGTAGHLKACLSRMLVSESFGPASRNGGLWKTRWADCADGSGRQRSASTHATLATHTRKRPCFGANLTFRLKTRLNLSGYAHRAVGL